MNELDVIKYFINKGLSPEAAMGMTGYFLGESSLNPDSVNKYSGAYGIGQWLGPRKKALFDAYGNKPTMLLQLDFAWNELNSTHKGALEQLKTLNDPQLASDMMYGGFGFGFGKLKPEKAAVAANKEMAKWGQNGEASRVIKRKHANRLYNTYGSIFNVNTDYNPQEYQVALKYNPSINTPSLKTKQVNKTLPEIEIKGTRRQPTEQSLNVPSLKSMTAQKMNYDMLKMAGMIEDEDDAFLNYMMLLRLNGPLLIPHYAGGKDGWTPDQGWTVTRRNGKSYVSLGLPEEPTMKRPYWVTAKTKQLNYGDLEKGYTAATAGMLPNYLTAARNFVQGDIQEGLVNLGMTTDTQLTPDGTTYAVVAPGVLDAEVNAARSFNNMLRRREDRQLALEILENDYLGRSIENTYRMFELPRIYEAEVEGAAFDYAIDRMLDSPIIREHGVDPFDMGYENASQLREQLFPTSRWRNLAYNETLAELYRRWTGNDVENMSLREINNYLNLHVFDILPARMELPHESRLSVSNVRSETSSATSTSSGKPTRNSLPEHLQNRPEIEQDLPSGSKTFDFQMNPKSVLENAKNTFDRMPSGAYYSLIKDGDLSTDSYTLLESLSRRWNDKVEIKIPRNPDGSVRMQKLNHLGKNRKLDDVRRAVQSLSRTTGVELPEVYSDRFDIFVPSFQLVKK